MHRPRNNDYGESSSFYERAHEQARTLNDTDSPKTEQSYSAESKGRALLTPRSTTSDKYRRTTSNPGSARRSEPQSEEFKRKQPLTPSIQTPEKVRRTTHGSKFVDSLIEQWVKNTGSHVSVAQPETPGNSSMEMESENHGQDCEAHRHALRTFRKKFQEAQEIITNFHVWRDNELKLKEQILAKINANYESMGVINKFSDYVTECVTVFQQKYDSLSALYNDVIITQRAAIQKLRQQLETIKAKDNGTDKVVAVMEERLKLQEQQLVELQRDMKKQGEEADNKLRTTKSQLESAHAEEKLKLAKERNELMMHNEHLESKLRRTEENSKNITAELTEYKSKLEDSTRQNFELIKNVEASALKASELAAELKSKTEELNKLEEHVTERRKIEIDLSKDLDEIGSKYFGQIDEYNTLQTNFNEIQRKLEDGQRQIADLEASIDKMKTTSKSEIVELTKQNEALKKEYENKLRGERKEEEMQTSKRTKEYNAKIITLQETIAKQHSDFAKVKESLDKSYEEKQSLQERFDRLNQNHQAELTKLRDSLDKVNAANQSLQNELFQMKETNEQLVSLKNMMEARNAASARVSVLQDIRNVKPKISEHQPVKEERTSSLKPNPQGLKSAILTRPVETINRQNKQGRMSLSQPTGSHKKVRFNLSSPEQDSQSLDLYSFSATTEDGSMSPNQVSKKDEKSEKAGAVSPNYKFFKSRGLVTKQYGSGRRARGRK